MRGYRLMSNHYHLEVETPEGDLSRSIQWINQKYAMFVNRVYRRVGHLFQGRFKSVLVEGELHLHELTRYIHLNPVRAGMVEHPGDYQWSSYRAYLGLRSSPEWLATGKTLRRFGESRKEQHRKYREFVERGVAEDPLREMKFGAVLGSRQFVEWFQQKVQAKRDDPEVSQLVKAKPRVSLARISALVHQTHGGPEDALHCRGRKRNEGRDLAIYLARLRSGCRLAEIGEFFDGIRPSAVRLAHKRIAEKMKKSRKFREMVAHLISRLTEDQKSKM